MNERVKENKIDSDSSDDDDDDVSLVSEHLDVQVLSSVEDGIESRYHASAVLIALFATLISFYRLSSGTSNESSNILSTKITKENILANDRHRGYRRTYGLNFCKDEEMTFNEDAINNYGMERFRFEYESKFDEIMISYFEEDDEAEKSVFNENSESLSKLNSQPNLNVECIKANNRPYTFGTAPVFISPHISTFYEVVQPKGIIAGKEIKQAYPSFTGFAARFYNLSPNKLVLWWEGGSGTRRRTRKIGEVAPFESIGTSTHNGQTFSFTPTYDKDHHLVRFIVTADDAISIYDAIKDAKSNGKHIKLSDEYQKKYKAQLLSLDFGRSYLVKTGRHWLSTFPRPPINYFMYESQYFGQQHTIQTKQTHFISMPPQNNLNKLSIQSHGSNPPVSLNSHRRTNEDYLTLTLKAISCSPRVFEIQNFLSSIEIDHILNLATNHQSSITTSALRVEDGTTQSSTDIWIDRSSSAIVDSVYRRAADLLQIDESLLRHREGYEHTELATDHSIAEAMQLTHYGEGQEYLTRHDMTFPSISNRYQPNRFATILIFLNDGMEGGETTFPRSVTADSHSGVKIVPKKGKAILYYNMLPDGNIDDLSQHAGKEVVKGEKWIANLWVWDPIID